MDRPFGPETCYGMLVARAITVDMLRNNEIQMTPSLCWEDIRCFGQREKQRKKLQCSHHDD